MKPLLLKFKVSFMIIGFVMLITTTREAPSCKLFPKIIGGNQGDTYFNAIAANVASDVLAAGGHTSDHELTGTSTFSQLPLIVVYKISTNDIRWMKTDTSKVGYTTNTISLSPNGNFLIGLLSPASSGTEYLYVYNSLNGNLLSSWKFVSASY